MDAHKNFAYGTVLTAPSPATSGTSMVLDSGQGALMPAVPFNLTVWPGTTQASASNAEIVRVTAISTDTLTITRAQESTPARAIVVGDRVAATVTNKVLTDAEFWDDRIVKPGDETISNSTTLQDDNDLQFAVVGGKTYIFEMVLMYDSGGTGDFKHAFALTAGSFTRGNRHHFGWGPTTVAGQTALTADMTTAITHGATPGEHLVVWVRGSFQPSTDATIKLQWAQNTTDGTNTTVKANSFIQWRRMSA